MAEQRWTAPESGWYRFGFGELPPESADVQYAEFDTEEHKPGDFLPGGPGWDARQQKILDDVSKAFALPEGLTWECGQIATAQPQGPPSFSQLMEDCARFLPRGPIADRLEIGSEAIAQLRISCAPTGQPSEGVSPLFDPIGHLTGIRVIEDPDLPPFTWRLYDAEGNVMRTYPEEQHG